MARLPDGPVDSGVADRIRARRGGALRPLDLMLLHSPPIADGWNSFLGAIRNATELRGDLRELVVLRIAVINDAGYEWDAHVGPAQREGIDERCLDALRTDRPGEPLDALQRLVIACTDALTRNVSLPDDLFEALRVELDDRQVLELLTTIAAYNMVSRVVVSLAISSVGATT